MVLFFMTYLSLMTSFTTTSLNFNFSFILITLTRFLPLLPLPPIYSSVYTNKNYEHSHSAFLPVYPALNCKLVCNDLCEYIQKTSIMIHCYLFLGLRLNFIRLAVQVERVMVICYICHICHINCIWVNIIKIVIYFQFVMIMRPRSTIITNQIFICHIDINIQIIIDVLIVVILSIIDIHV
jgi:hypothetical protein